MKLYKVHFPKFRSIYIVTENENKLMRILSQEIEKWEKIEVLASTNENLIIDNPNVD